MIDEDKAEPFRTTIIIITIIGVLAGIVTWQVWDSNDEAIVKINNQDIVTKGQYMLVDLLSTSGYPENWHEKSGGFKIGLLTDFKLDPIKIEKFYEVEQDYIRTLYSLDGYEFDLLYKLNNVTVNSFNKTIPEDDQSYTHIKNKYDEENIFYLYFWKKERNSTVD